MSESSAPVLDALQELVESTVESDYATDGFHQRHVAAADSLPALARVFRDQTYFLEMITCEDRRQDSNAMRLVYTFNRFGAVDRHLVHADIEPGVEAPSIVCVYRSADWMEREVYDMYGVRFSGHPELKRILLPDDADFHALLKDFGRMEDAETEPEAAKQDEGAAS